MTTRTLQNLINGELVDSADGRTSTLINPSTEEEFAQAAVSGHEDVDRAFTAAAKAYETWRDSTPSERQRALLKLADAMEDRAGEFVKIESENTGKPLGFTETEELPPSIDQVRFFAGAARVLEGRSAGEYLAGHTSYVRREPIGVVAQVTPWNYPLMMAIWKIAPALAAGNTLVIKPSAGLDAAARRAVQRVLPARRGQRGDGRPGHRPGARGAPGAQDGLDHRVRTRRHRGRRVGRP
jgi:betaine-aldehyde dehydrogenase